MLYTLDNFYQSKEWEKCRKTVISERLTEEGFTICEYCNKPILKSYDIIGHHKQQLTNANVNDAEVSLNTENIMLVHHKCHNMIHEKLGHKKQNVYLVYGSPLSGKNEYVNSIKQSGDLIVDIDSIWQCISGDERYIKDGRLKSIAFKLRNELLDSVKYRQGKWRNAFVIGGYPFKNERERLATTLNAKIIYVESTKEECLQRLVQSERPKIWREFINDWWENFEE
ncbi:MAG: HNH endonuclease [Lachnospiraceae bacterium]|nr:HNH endonuclease [Lachnospiraceae bacterium]